MNLARALVIALLVASATACGDGDPTGPSGDGSSMTAVINGTPWSAEALISNAQYNETDELLVLSGLNTTSYAIAITLADVTETGTYPLTATFPLRFAVVTTNAGGSWTSTIAAVMGSVTLATFTGTRVTGTFSFDAEAMGSSTIPTPLSVTGGQFDLALTRLNP